MTVMTTMALTITTTTVAVADGVGSRMTQVLFRQTEIISHGVAERFPIVIRHTPCYCYCYYCYCYYVIIVVRLVLVLLLLLFDKVRRYKNKILSSFVVVMVGSE